MVTIWLIYGYYMVNDVFLITPPPQKSRVFIHRAKKHMLVILVQYFTPILIVVVGM